MRQRIVIIWVFLCLNMAASAQTGTNTTKKVGTELPPVVIAGLEAYRSKGPDEAVRTWIKGSPIDGSKDALSQANILRQIQDYYGTYESFEIAGSREITPRVRNIYLVLEFEKGPLFGKFMVYKTEQGWVLTSFLFNTKEAAVFPDPI